MLVSSVTCVNFLIVWYSSPTIILQSPFDKNVLQLFKQSSNKVTTGKECDHHMVGLWLHVDVFERLPTFHDGGKQNTPTTYFVAKSLMINSQEAGRCLICSKFNG